MIGLGLYSEPGADPRFELEAGGNFAANFMVYWPFLLVVTPLLIVTGIFGLLPYRFAPGGTMVGAVIASVFAQWVATELYLSDYRPALSGYLETSLVAACCALAAAFAAAFLHLHGNRTSRTRAASIRGAAVLVAAVLAGAAVTIPPLIAENGTPSGVLAGIVSDPHCGRKSSDWTEAGQAAVYTGSATQSYPPNDMSGTVFEVVVTLHDGTGSVATTPPTAISFRAEQPSRFSPPGTEVLLHQRDSGNGFAFTRLRAPKCRAGSSRVVSATYEYSDYGRPGTSKIAGTVSRGD
ncbi:hypothetical protein [Nocardia sp. NPDC051832]|uniref:hypothetical protein n=1 Tax=Nocardia sp. NPDC051832 TaxID=3155673 RepID=UPI0034287AD6